MSFGHAPLKKRDNAFQKKTSLKRLIHSLVGWPHFLRRLQWHTLLEFLAIEDDMIIIDVGAGPMQYAIELTKHVNAMVVAVDLKISSEAGELATRHRVAPVQANAQALPFKDGSVDRILLSSTLHMVPDPEVLLAECRRVLKQNGGLVLSVPNHFQFISALFDMRLCAFICKCVGSPPNYKGLVALLNERFFVIGPRGYHTYDELRRLIEKQQFRIVRHRFAPGWLGSLLWEIGVLGYLRFGNIAFYSLFLFYPLARAYDVLFDSARGSEHIVQLSVDHRLEGALH